MILGGLPRLKLDRAGVALLGAIAGISLGATTTDAAARVVDLLTIVLLFSAWWFRPKCVWAGFTPP